MVSMQRRAFSILTAGIALSVLGAMGGPALASSSISASPPKAAAAPAASVPVTDPWANLVEEPLGPFPTDPSATKWAPTPDGPSDLHTYPPGTTATSGAPAVRQAGVHPRTLTVTVTDTADQDIYTLTPDVLGTLTSSAGGTVKGYFYVRTHGSGTWNLANAAEVDVASGTVASWRFADQMGTPGGLYDWQMKACQSTTCSALTTIVTFEINPMVGAGDRTFYGYYDQNLSADASAHVNYANGDLAVNWNDLSIAGVDGLNLDFDRTYNSITDETIALSDFGSHWTNALTDPFTAVQSSGGIRLQGPSGYLAEFSKRGTNYISPSGLDADVLLSGGSTTTMTFHHDADGYQQGEQLIFIGDYLHTIKDKHGNTLSLSYYSGSPVEVKTITDNQTGRTITMSNYNAAGQAQTVTDNTGRTLAYTYDSSGNLSTFADAGEGTITGDATTQYTYDSAHELTQITDPAGIITKIGYTANQVSSLTRGYGTSDQQTTDFAYYPVGNPTCSLHASYACTVVVQDRGTEPPTSGDGTYESTTYYHDQSGRILYVLDDANQSESTSWDVNSNVLVQSDKLTYPVVTTGYDTNGFNNPITGTDATGATDTLAYPSLGASYSYQPTSQNLPNNESNKTAAQALYYYGSPTGSTAYGDITQAVQGSTTLNASYQGDGTTTCSAKPGEVCTTTNGKTGVTSYGYDTHGDLTSISPPAPLVATSDTVDALGRVATSTDGLHQVTTVHYDVLDRVSEVDYPASSATIKYTYDGNGNTTQVQVITGTTATYTFTYDNLNRLTHKTLPANTTVVTDDAYSYDKLGNLLKLTESGVTGGHTLSLTTNYTYNNLNLPTTVAGSTLDPSGAAGSTASIALGQDADGRLNSITNGSGGDVRTITYDKAGREVEAESMTKAIGGTALTNLVYCYVSPVASCPTTPNGPPTGTFVVTNNKQTAIDTVAGTTLSYTYDGLNRLTDANTTAGGTDHRSYGYDADGNRTSQTINGTNTTYTFNNADQATTTGYSYDADGNATAIPGLSNLTYNTLNQTTAITKSGTTTHFVYAGGDQSTRITANNIDAALSSLGTDIEASTGSVYHFYVRGPGGNLLAIVNDNAGTLTTRYPILDGLGSVVGLTNGTGTIEDISSYDPYGNLLSHTGTDYNPFGFAGDYADGATGLMHLGARYYNPTDGRFVQQDPSGNAANPYGYAGANPTNIVDPSGLWGISLGGSVCFGICLGVSVTVGTGGVSVSGEAGVGPSGGAEVTGTVTTDSGSDSGGYYGVDCSGPGVTGSIDQSGSGGYSGSGGVSSATQYGCSSEVGYTQSLFSY
jgi:RHS repeat-associated protein